MKIKFYAKTNIFPQKSYVFARNQFFYENRILVLKLKFWFKINFFGGMHCVLAMATKTKCPDLYRFGPLKTVKLCDIFKIIAYFQMIRATKITSWPASGQSGLGCLFWIILRT